MSNPASALGDSVSGRSSITGVNRLSVRLQVLYALLAQAHALSSASHPASGAAPSGGPSNADIEAVIQAATSSSGPLSPTARDSRTQLFVGNVSSGAPVLPVV